MKYKGEKMNGLFITVEGPDGAGKSSVIKYIAPKIEAYLQKKVVITREPGGSVLAEHIRTLLLDPTYTEMDVKTEALLMAASRRQHIKDTIQPHLAQGNIVLSDRYVDSSLAYQGAGRQLGIDNIRQINAFAIEDLWPHATLLLQVDAETGLARIHHKDAKRQVDRLEQEDISFHNRVSDGYNTLLKAEPERFICVDASLEISEVLQMSWQQLQMKLDKLVT